MEGTISVGLKFTPKWPFIIWFRAMGLEQCWSIQEPSPIQMFDRKLASSKCLSQICRWLKFDKKTGSFTISTNTCIGRCFLGHAKSKQLLFVGGPGATLRIIYKLVNDHDPHGIAMMACHQHLQNSTDSMEQKNQSQGDSNDKSFLPMEKRNDQIDQTYPFLKPVVFFHEYFKMSSLCPTFQPSWDALA